MTRLEFIFDYAQGLQADVNLGLMEPEQRLRTIESLRSAGQLTPEQYASLIGEKSKYTFSIEEVSKDDPSVKKLKDLFYREIFGETSSTEGEELETEVLLGEVNNKVGGALWYACSPTEGYQGCVYLDLFYVSPDFRGSGLGTHLLVHLLQKTPEDHCIVTHAWKPSIPFYQNHGFLTPSDLQHQNGGQTFQKMVLPLTKQSLERFFREEELDIGDCYQEVIESRRGLADLGDGFLDRLVGEINGLTPDQEADLAKNPLAVFIYQRAGLDHYMLK